MINKAHTTTSSVKHISLTWAIALPSCFILGWLVGYLLASNPISGSDIGSLIGLTLGGTISGLGTALELRARYPSIKAVHIIVIIVGWAIGWAIAIFVLANFRHAIIQGN